MSQAHLTAFLADLRTINAGININDWFGTRTSLSGLITHLQNTVNNPVPLSVMDARHRCADPADARIVKYIPAIQRLVSVWGRGAHRRYPNAAGFLAAQDYLQTRAQLNFNAHVLTVAAPLRPLYHELADHDDNPFAFSMTLGNAYLHRVAGANGNIDITARSLLLKAGLGIPDAVGTDNGYADKLRLTQAVLDAMAGHSILDVGCGAAIFRAEMETLYGCTSTGIDPYYNHIPAAIPAGQRRYVKSMLYLKMLSDMGVLGRSTTPLWTGPMIGTLVQNFNGILQAYADNPPQNGNVFDLAAAVIAHQGRGWGYCVTMFVLCYFTPEEQTDAILNMCSVAQRAVFIHNGNGGGVLTQRLYYDEQQIRHAFPGCRIEVHDERTHHIFLH